MLSMKNSHINLDTLTVKQQKPLPTSSPIVYHPPCTYAIHGFRPSTSSSWIRCPCSILSISSAIHIAHLSHPYTLHTTTPNSQNPKPIKNAEQEKRIADREGLGHSLPPYVRTGTGVTGVSDASPRRVLRARKIARAAGQG